MGWKGWEGEGKHTHALGRAAIAKTRAQAKKEAKARKEANAKAARVAKRGGGKHASDKKGWLW